MLKVLCRTLPASHLKMMGWKRGWALGEGISGFKLSADAELDKWLSRKGAECLLDSDADEVVGFESLMNCSK